MVDFCELNSTDFENSIMKNQFIQSTRGEWICFIDASITSREDIDSILKENTFLSEYDAILFCSKELDGEINLFDLLYNPQCVIYAFGIQRELLIKTGSFNQLLEFNTNYEFLLRAAEVGSMYAVSCSAEKEAVFDPFTMAYVMRRYMSVLKETGQLESVFLKMVQEAGRLKKGDDFKRAMNAFLSQDEEYIKLVEDTAPFLIFVGTDKWCGVLQGFANSLADELVSLGQAVITTNNTYGEYSKIPTEKLMNQYYKAVIGFQASALEKDIFRNMNGRKVQFWFDNPIFFEDFFCNHSKETYVLCQDAYYADYIRGYYGLPNAMQFPPGGNVFEGEICEKIYDVAFVGSYEPLPEGTYGDAFLDGFYQYMLAHIDFTFEQGMSAYGQTLGKNYDKKEIAKYLQKAEDVCFDVLQKDRHEVIEKIVSSGITLHVFGDSWKNYQGKGRENLIIHPQVVGKEALQIFAQSKIGFNIMRGHKAGMTERIANIMLCGACCLSDETVYLREHFCDGKDIALFKRSELDTLPVKIHYLLEHDGEREQIAAAGYEKALREHTWRKRAEQLLELLNS